MQYGCSRRGAAGAAVETPEEAIVPRMNALHPCPLAAPSLLSAAQPRGHISHPERRFRVRERVFRLGDGSGIEKPLLVSGSWTRRV